MYETVDLKKIKYLGYIRKSSEAEDRQVLSLESQEKEIREMARKRGLNIIDVISESHSAKDWGQRKGFNLVLQKVKNGENNGVLVWSEDRLSRNSIDTAFLVDLIDKDKLTVVSTINRDYFNNPQDKLWLQSQMTQAKYDNDKRSVDVKRGNRQKLEKGQWAGLAKVGYMNVGNQLTGERTITKDPERFDLVKNAFHLILNKGYTPFKALKTLNNDWLFKTRQYRKSGNKPLTTSAWYRMLKDPYYYGFIKRKDGEVWGSHEPMLTEDEYKRIQIILGAKGKPRTINHNFPYKQLLKCGACNGNITAHEKYQIICPVCKTKFAVNKNRIACISCDTSIENMPNPKILHYNYYNCTGNKGVNCKERAITKKVIEDTVALELLGIKITDDFQNWAIKYLSELRDNDQENKITIYSNLIKQYDSINTQINALLFLKISPDNVDGNLLSDEEYNATRLIFLKEKTDLETKLSNDEQTTNQEDLSKTFEFARYAQYWFEKGSDEEKTSIMRDLSLNLKIMDKKLLIDKKKAYFVIQEMNEKEKSIREQLEPEIIAGTKTNKDLEDTLIPIWQGRKESNPQ